MLCIQLWLAKRICSSIAALNCINSIRPIFHSGTALVNAFLLELSRISVRGYVLRALVVVAANELNWMRGVWADETSFYLFSFV